MVLLARNTRPTPESGTVRSRRGLVAGLFLCLWAGACFLASGGPEPGPHFSHADHGEDKGLKCVTCHTSAYTGDKASQPGPQICETCHEKVDKDKPPERRLAAFFDENGRYKTTRVDHLPTEVRFSHGKHAQHDVKCEDCHGDVGNSDLIPAESVVTKDDCLTCHSKAGSANECADCHTEINKGWLPPTHLHSWDVRHGQVVRGRDSELMNRCDMCHQEQSCQTCHRKNPPRDHTNFWRRRGHGIMVSIDRSRCMTCHRTDFCSRCHEGTRPLNHTASWGDPTNRHCNDCHFPLNSTGCITCHKGAPSHQLATPLPPGHNPAMNCRQCHGAGQPLPHPDGGHVCTICHR